MRRRPSTYRGPLVLLVTCLTLVFVGSPAGAAPGGDPIPPRSTPTETGKYYVVGPPVDGQREFLYAIAVKTLGDGTRYREILLLNQGRPQPDGGQLVDATTVEPGWILILPADAAGPDVLTGALPMPAGSPAAAAGPGTTGGGSGDWTSTGLRVALIVLAVLLVIWAQVTLMIRRRAHPMPVTDPGTGPGADADADDDADTGSAVESDPGSATATDRVARTVVVPRPATAPLPDLDVATMLPPVASHPFATLVTALDCDGQPARVRLVGARPARWGSAYGWLPAGRRPPPATAALILGEHDGLRLWADLGRAPDALTVVGNPAAAERHAATLVAQLGAETDVVVAGDALGDDLPDGARWVPEVADLAADRSTTRMSVVVCSAADVPALRGPLRQLARDGRQTVPVIVGLAPAARWSIRIGDAGTPPSTGGGPRSGAS
ncbi:hypothetical protein O7623_19045 [Solwaraspora sp. WMMD791]|uniref:hypothetical protein n=1 Tax=Solwaraspora sp. WMMD791 TaxID=3016086 RepID=UPI00249AB1F9|nr:hypothetical protein [Solwaraspora sp. WMMD791]WFE25482.1 hypothetical protein O7623_19045 [Solwaraspora sp. WMMD791]